MDLPMAVADRHQAPAAIRYSYRGDKYIFEAHFSVEQWHQIRSVTASPTTAGTTPSPSDSSLPSSRTSCIAATGRRAPCPWARSSGKSQLSAIPAASTPPSVAPVWLTMPLAPSSWREAPSRRVRQTGKGSAVFRWP